MIYRRFLKYLQVDTQFLVLIFLLSYVLVIKNRISAGMVSWYTLTPEGPVAQFVAALVIFSLVRVGLNHFATHQQATVRDSIVAGVVGLVMYLVSVNAFEFLVAAAFGNIERNFSALLLLQRNVSLLVDMALYSGVYLAYQHRKNALDYAKELANKQRELTQTQIQQLKAQLNPHFIFNALNTLDELIYVEPKRASEYLHDFAELQRLAITNGGKSLVPVADELAFAQHYFHLMKTRLGTGFTLSVKGEPANEAKIPPFTLQILIENVFVHNEANAEKPVQIEVVLLPSMLTVTNTLSPRAKKGASNGIGLDNLATQIELLTGKEMEVQRSVDQFKVRVPLCTGL